MIYMGTDEIQIVNEYSFLHFMKYYCYWFLGSLFVIIPWTLILIMCLVLTFFGYGEIALDGPAILIGALAVLVVVLPLAQLKQSAKNGNTKVEFLFYPRKIQVIEGKSIKEITKESITKIIVNKKLAYIQSPEYRNFIFISENEQHELRAFLTSHEYHIKGHRWIH